MQMIEVLRWLLLAAQVYLACSVLYLDILAISAIVSARRRRHDSALLRVSPDEAHHFAILVPAHNEELLLGRLLDSLARLDYPPDRYTVHVVADNCTDATAPLARAAGATVFERNDTSKRGKGFALHWLLEQMSKAGMRPDAYVVVDADSVVAPDFLRAMACELARGA